MKHDADNRPPLPPERDRNPLVGGIRSYLELLRVPNVFTAASDVAMGYLVTHVVLDCPVATEPLAHFGLLVAASCLLYMAGMALNDVFDAEVDAHERPERPIPSGRVSLAVARVIGWELLICGTACAWLVSYFENNWWPGVVGSLLAGTVLLYDGAAKKTPFGPAVMATCRGLNVLLGMSLAVEFAATGIPLAWTAPYWLIIAGIAVYVYGVTLFARDEADIGEGSQKARRICLVLGTIVLLSGMAVLACLPLAIERFALGMARWWILWGVLTALVGWRCVRATVDPRPTLIRSAVGYAITSIIFLDAAVTAGVCGSFWGLTVLMLAIPTLLLRRWFSST